MPLGGDWEIPILPLWEGCLTALAETFLSDHNALGASVLKHLAVIDERTDRIVAVEPDPVCAGALLDSPR